MLQITRNVSTVERNRELNAGLVQCDFFELEELKYKNNDSVVVELEAVAFVGSPCGFDGELPFGKVLDFLRYSLDFFHGKADTYRLRRL